MSTDDKPAHETLSLLSVEELLSKKGVIQRKFFIPAYQRGYRWTKSHVTRLIDDWNEFMKEAADTDFYCLQPLVTKPVDTAKFPEFAEYEEVIDGQQRLTTVLLILQAIHSLIKTKDPNEEENIVITIVPRRYELKYETRESSDVWLNKLKSITSFDDPNAKQLIDSNCDYSHLIEVYVTAYNLLKVPATVPVE